MNCPVCNDPNTHVIRTYRAKLKNTIERRRKCEKCRNVFWTMEASQPPKEFIVEKKDNSVETFSYEKLFRSIRLACDHLNIKYSEQRDIFIDVMSGVTVLSTKSSRIGSEEIGELVTTALEKTNRIAWLRYIAFYDDNEATIKKRIEAWFKK